MALVVITYLIHKTAVARLDLVHPYDLRAVYIFQAVASVLLVIAFELVATFSGQFKDQLGFLYLGSIALKMMLFCIVFREVLFSSVAMSKEDSLSLLIPIFIFLFYEVLILVKILNRGV